jgi:hypothetical protein
MYWFWISIALVILGSGPVCALKGKWKLAVVGLIAPAPFWIPGAIRLAKPGSWWARRWYSPEKLALANARFPKAKKTTQEGIALKSSKKNAPQPPAAAHVLPTVAEPAADQRATQAPSATPAPRPTLSNMTSELERLAKLHANGALDEAEFRAAKARLLAAGSVTPVAPGGVTSVAPRAATGMSAPLVAGAAGVAGGLLLGNVGGASAAPTAGEPASETINYHETFTGPDGEATTIDGTMESTVTFDDSGDAHVEVHDSGTVDLGGEASHYDSDVSGDVDLGGTTEEGGGFLSGLFDLF